MAVIKLFNCIIAMGWFPWNCYPILKDASCIWYPSYSTFYIKWIFFINMKHSSLLHDLLPLHKRIKLNIWSFLIIGTFELWISYALLFGSFTYKNASITCFFNEELRSWSGTAFLNSIIISLLISLNIWYILKLI